MVGCTAARITVPLQMVEFYLILAAVQPTINAGIFWRLLLGTVAMLVAGYCGEAGFVNAWAGFMVGMAGWAFILFEIFSGEAGKLAEDDKVSENVKTSFQTMRIIVSPVTAVRLGSSTHGLDSWWAWPAGHSSSSRSSPVRL